MIGLFDDALVRFFSRIAWEGKPLPVVIASADKAFGSIERWWQDNYSGQLNPQDHRHIPLPFASLWRTRFNPVLDEMSSKRLPVSFTDFDAGMSMVAAYPITVTANVTLDVWCRDPVDADFLNIQLISLFRTPLEYLEVNWNDDRWSTEPYEDLDYLRYWGTQGFELEFESIEDNTDLEFGDGPVESRFTFSGRMTAMMPRGLLLHPIAKRLILSVDAAYTPETPAAEAEQPFTVEIEET